MQTKLLKYEYAGSRSLITNEFAQKHSVIAIFDALGTKHIDKDEVEKRFEAWLELTQFIDMNIGLMNEDQPNHILTGQLSFSDTLFILAKSEKEIDADFLLRISKLFSAVMTEAFKQDILFRGSMGCREYYLRESSVVGRGIDEAYLYHEATNWIGFAASPSAHDQLVQCFDERSETAEKLRRVWQEYDIPLQGFNPDQNGLALKWGKENLDSLEKYQPTVEKLRQMMDKINDLDVMFKYRNTIRFLDYRDSPWKYNPRTNYPYV